MTDLSEPLSAFMTRIAGPGALSCLARLSGGANMESWAFAWGGAAYVLRRAPSDDYMAGRPYGHAVEAALVAAAHAGGVKAPEVVGVLADADGLGTGYVMRRIAGLSTCTRLTSTRRGGRRLRGAAGGSGCKSGEADKADKADVLGRERSVMAAFWKGAGRAPAVGG